MTGDLGSSFQSLRKMSFPLLFTLTCHSLAEPTNTQSSVLLLGLSLYILLPTLFLFLLCFRVGFPALTLSFIWFPLYLRALLWCFWALLLHCYLFILFSTACSLRKQLKIQALALTLLLEILVYICNNYSIHSKTKQTDLISSSFLPQDWTLEVICHQPKSDVIWFSHVFLHLFVDGTASYTHDF